MAALADLLRTQSPPDPSMFGGQLSPLQRLLQQAMQTQSPAPAKPLLTSPMASLIAQVAANAQAPGATAAPAPAAPMLTPPPPAPQAQPQAQPQAAMPLAPNAGLPDTGALTPAPMPGADKIAKPDTGDTPPSASFWDRISNIGGKDVRSTDLMALAASLIDAGQGGRSLNEPSGWARAAQAISGFSDSLDQRRTQQNEQAWQKQERGRQVTAWNQEDQQTAARNAYIDRVAQTDPERAQTLRANPRLADQVMASEAIPQYASNGILMRTNPVTGLPEPVTGADGAPVEMPLSEREQYARRAQQRELDIASRRAGGGGGGLAGIPGMTAEDVQSAREDMAMTVAMTGMPVQDVTGSRRGQDNTAISTMAAGIRHRLGFSPETFAAARAAYLGDTRSYGHLVQLRDQVVANENAAVLALQNVADLQGRLTSADLSRIPVGNDALQALNNTLRGNGPLGAYVASIATARMEVARVLSGNNSPPVEAMHEAERIVPNNITPQALPDIIANAQREMRYRSGAFDTTLGTVRQRLSGSQSANLPTDNNGGVAFQVRGADGNIHNLRFNQATMDTLQRQLEDGSLNTQFITEEEAQRALDQWGDRGRNVAAGPGTPGSSADAAAGGDQGGAGGFTQQDIQAELRRRGLAPAAPAAAPAGADTSHPLRDAAGNLLGQAMHSFMQTDAARSFMRDFNPQPGDRRTMGGHVSEYRLTNRRDANGRPIGAWVRVD